MKELDELYRDGYLSERTVQEVEERLNLKQELKEKDARNKLSEVLFEREMLKVIAKTGGINL